jgi:hypothetical protein
MAIAPLAKPATVGTIRATVQTNLRTTATAIAQEVVGTKVVKVTTETTTTWTANRRQGRMQDWIAKVRALHPCYDLQQPGGY